MSADSFMFHKAKVLLACLRFGEPNAWLQKFALLASPFPKDHAIIRLARKWFVRGVFRAATVRERSSDCRPIIFREFMQPSTKSVYSRGKIDTNAKSAVRIPQ